MPERISSPFPFFLLVAGSKKRYKEQNSESGADTNVMQYGRKRFAIPLAVIMKHKPSNTRMLSLMMALCVLLMYPGNASATQMHSGSEGIIVHQMGHLFFMISMAILIFTINGKGLDREHGWKRLQYSAFLFILWNLDATCAHFLDNQINAVTVTMLDNWQISITAHNHSRLLAGIYYILKLDHLLCVPAIALFYSGLRQMLAAENNGRAFGSLQ